MRPRLTGCNIGLWRTDIERINGFDENYIGWGMEDRDLQLRLSRLGLRFKSILHKTVAYHMWHPPHSTFARNGEGTLNLSYFEREEVPTWCQNGLVKWNPAGQEPDNAEELESGVIPFPVPAERPKRAAA